MWKPDETDPCEQCERELPHECDSLSIADEPDVIYEGYANVDPNGSQT